MGAQSDTIKGEGGFKNKSKDENIAPVGHRQGPVGLGKGNFHYRFFITYRISEPVIYEYNGRGETDFAQTLTYPQGNRNYYRKGDILFPIERSMNDLRKYYPSLYPKGQEKSLLENLCDSEILGASPDIKTALVIWSIEPTKGSPGYGLVHFKPVIFFGESIAVLYDEREKTFDLQLLNIAYGEYPYLVAMRSWLPIIRFVSEVMIMVITGMAKSAISKSASVFIIENASVKACTKLALKQALKAGLKAIRNNIPKASLASTKAFIIEFIKQISSDKQEESLRQIAEKNKNIDYKAFSSAIKSGINAFVMTFLQESFGEMISSIAEKTGLKNSIKEFLTQELMKLETEFAQTFLTAYLNAINDAHRGKTAKPGKMELANSLQTECPKWFEAKTKDILGRLFDKLGSK